MKTSKQIYAASFHWQRLLNCTYRFFSETDTCGSLSLSMEPSIQPLPEGYNFYRGDSEIAGQAYAFKCYFLDRFFRGCMLLERDTGQLVALYQEGSPLMRWCRQSQIVLSKKGICYQWLRGQEKGRWILRTALAPLLEVTSLRPRDNGMVRILNQDFLKNPDAYGVIMFCIYLAIGPVRPHRQAA